MSALGFLRRESAPTATLRDGSTVSIAPMRRRDLRHGVLDVERASHPLPWSHNVFCGEIDQIRSGSRWYVTARRNGSIVGHAGLWFAPDEAHVTNVAVAPEHRRLGIARTLLLALADEAIDRGVAAWTLEVRASGIGAQELYRSFGFAPAGIRKNYYDNIEDALVMWCHDIDTAAYRELLDTMRRPRHPVAGGHASSTGEETVE